MGDSTNSYPHVESHCGFLLQIHVLMFFLTIGPHCWTLAVQEPARICMRDHKSCNFRVFDIWTTTAGHSRLQFSTGLLHVITSMAKVATKGALGPPVVHNTCQVRMHFPWGDLDAIIRNEISCGQLA
jgi:hypothetical protein